MAIVAKAVLIDYNILGWAHSQENKILKSYNKVVKVGSEELPRREYDEHLARYCRDSDCDLLTADKTAYMKYFEIGVKEIAVSCYDWDKAGDNPVFLIKILK